MQRWIIWLVLLLDCAATGFQFGASPSAGRTRAITTVALSVAVDAQSQALLEEIVHHPAVAALAVELRPRSRLKPKHQPLFADTAAATTTKTQRLLNDLGQVICETGVVNRKEFLETFAAAVIIHEYHPLVTRMADLAAGHGLLAWILLVLDHNSSSTKDNDTSRPRTVVCVDRRIPPSTDIIATAMKKRYPSLAERWSYVQADLSCVEPDPSCLLVSVHACGILSDLLIQMAIEKNSPIAIVPCCHTVRNNYRPHVVSGMTAEHVVALVEERKLQLDGNAKHEAVGDVVDSVRCQTLRKAGFKVDQVLLPKTFTARNRLLLAEPTGETTTGGATSERQLFFQRTTNTRAMRVPLTDNDRSIAQCQAISGRERAVTRFVEQIPKHFSFTLAMSIWLDSNLTLATLQTFIDRGCGDIQTGLQCTVYVSDEVNVQASTGRKSQLYRFAYTRVDGGNMSGTPRVTAKTIHQELLSTIVGEFGDVLR